eukprot:4494874-Pyramimonas_sp.AAC.1
MQQTNAPDDSESVSGNISSVASKSQVKYRKPSTRVKMTRNALGSCKSFDSDIGATDLRN